MPPTRPAPSGAATPVLLVVVGIASVQFGAAVAKHLFDQVTPTTIVWLRLTTSALVLLAVARPRMRDRTPADWATVVGFGLSLAVMNWAFYQALDRIPLGIAVTVEFVGPLSLAVAGSRRWRDLAWVGLAGVGVALLGAERGDLTLAGVLLALLAGVCWAGYILLAARTGRTWSGVEGLAVASAVAALAMTVVLPITGPIDLGGWRIVTLGVMVGLLSSVVPYSCEISALRRLPPATFSVLMSLEPAAAALAGILVIGEVLAPAQWAAVGCVVVASIGATRTRSTLAAPAPD